MRVKEHQIRRNAFDVAYKVIKTHWPAAAVRGVHGSLKGWKARVERREQAGLPKSEEHIHEVDWARKAP